MRAFVEGVGVVGPGLDGWPASRPLLAGEAEYHETLTILAECDLLPATERRRAGVPVKLALAAGQEAFAGAGREAAATASVFASSSGDCENVHHILESLATSSREVSPMRFHNSVHNAAAGYWSIATRCRETSTSISGHDASFSAGLLEAAAQVATGCAVVLIAYDHPYPEPLNRVRPVRTSFGVALVLAPDATRHAVAALEVEFAPRTGVATRMTDPRLEAVRSGVPAARSLPLLAALARSSREAIVLEYVEGTHLRVTVEPCS